MIKAGIQDHEKIAMADLPKSNLPDDKHIYYKSIKNILLGKAMNELFCCFVQLISSP